MQLRFLRQTRASPRGLPQKFVRPVCDFWRQLRERQVDTVATKYTARFCEQNYIPHRPVQPFNSKIGFRKYRGIGYGG